MKKKLLSLYYITFVLICQVIGGIFVGGGASALNTENFYFEDFTADYYLSRDEAGISHLKVVENFTTIFPDYNQNKGICREIPMTNYGGVNLVLESLSFSNVKLLRNGLTEPIYSIEKSGDYWEVCTGDDDYVTGRQVYTFEYAFDRVVTDFDTFQELYWDTNGNGWSQRFDSVTARVHFVGGVANDITGESWCYVGKYGEKNSHECKISKIDDGVEFETSGLSSYENLTFNIEIKPGAFYVPEPEKNYALLIILGFVAVVCGLIMIFPIRKFMASRELANYYKGLFVKPEYQPNKDYTLPEMAELYFGKKKDAKVGILLELIVNGKIEIITDGEGLFGAKKWKVKVVSLDGVDDPAISVLKILNGGEMPVVGGEIEVKRRDATMKLVSIKKEYENGILARLKADGLVNDKYRLGAKEGGLFIWIIIWVVVFFMLGIFIPLGDFIIDAFGGTVGKILVGEDVFLPICGVLIVATILACSLLMWSAEKYKGYNKKGLEAARYMDGLKLYIEMAETERIKFLQSVENAEVSKEGVVKLYEKLLPYAAIFGLEKSWMTELEKYYKMDDIESPNWYSSTNTLDVIYVSSVITNYVNFASTISSSGGSIAGGGGSSSGFSGGGGGGFSGGGGGGGGGHGR